ncbi:MAG: hypothetical protein IH914_02305, partial [candidate division Zixibacteria bacterium]|nr:hypothetical protein [candidate division Zixibacteria bacterium]
MVHVQFRGEKKISFEVTTKEAREWIAFGLARWSGRIKGDSVIELKRQRGSSTVADMKPDLSLRMNPSE